MEDKLNKMKGNSVLNNIHFDLNDQHRVLRKINSKLPQHKQPIKSLFGIMVSLGLLASLFMIFIWPNGNGRLLLNGSPPKTLQTDQLIKEKNVGALKGDPITYHATNVKKALYALPFKMKLPYRLPLDIKGFQNVDIKDFSHDGKDIQVTFTAFSTDKHDRLIVYANNMNSIYRGNTSEKVKLNHGIVGAYSGSSLSFENKGIIYNIALVYNGSKVNQNQHEKELIDLANQIIE